MALSCDGCGRPVAVHEVKRVGERIFCPVCAIVLDGGSSMPSSPAPSAGTARLAYLIFCGLGILPLAGAGACAAFTFFSAASGVPRENYAAVWDLGFFLLLPGLLFITPAIIIHRMLLRKRGPAPDRVAPVSAAQRILNKAKHRVRTG